MLLRLAHYTALNYERIVAVFFRGEVKWGSRRSATSETWITSTAVSCEVTLLSKDIKFGLFTVAAFSYCSKLSDTVIFQPFESHIPQGAAQAVLAR